MTCAAGSAFAFPFPGKLKAGGLETYYLAVGQLSRQKLRLQKHRTESSCSGLAGFRVSPFRFSFFVFAAENRLKVVSFRFFGCFEGILRKEPLRVTKPYVAFAFWRSYVVYGESRAIAYIIIISFLDFFFLHN